MHTCIILVKHLNVYVSGFVWSNKFVNTYMNQSLGYKFYLTACSSSS